MTDQSRIRRQIRRALKDADEIRSFYYPLDHRDLKQNLFNARAIREDAVRILVLEMSMGLEEIIDELFRNTLLEHTLMSKKRGPRTIARALGEVLESGRIGFESKLKLVRALRIVTKRQYNSLDRLRVLRNKCAHEWVLDVVHKRRKGLRPTRRLLEFDGKNLFDLNVLRQFMHVYSGIYLKLHSKSVY